MDLKELLTDPMFLDLVEDYVISLPDKIEQLRTATRQSDWETVKTISHQLKGSGGGYGFNEVSNAAAAIEMLCEPKKPDRKTLERKIEALSEACLVARELLEEHRHLI